MNTLKQYLITDPHFYSSDIKVFEEKLNHVLKNNRVDIACFRDKSSSNIKELATLFIDTCRKHGIENIFINQKLDLAQSLNYDGIHLTSNQFNKIQEAKEAGLKTIISCHTFEEIKKAMKLEANMVTYSPIFFTPNKGEPKGIEKLFEATDKFAIDIIALGGIISDIQVKEIERTKAKGFASIRYFI